MSLLPSGRLDAQDHFKQNPQTSLALPCPTAFKVDPSAFKTAQETGSQFAMLEPSERARASGLMEKIGEGTEDPILLIYGELKAGAKEFALPVDSTVQTLAISVFLQCVKSIAIVDPAGAQVNPGPQVQEATFHSGRLLKVDAPQNGLWRIKIEGDGLYSVVVHARSGIQFTKAEFVGSEEDPASVATGAALKAGASQKLKATLRGNYSSVQFVLMTLDGMPSVLKMTHATESADPGEFFGDVTLPSQPFRIIAEGADQTGQIYRRFFPPLFYTTP